MLAASAWGNPADPQPAMGNRRSIPARAGEPVTRGLLATTLGVYPRACGGTPGIRSKRTSAPGLSPRVRGNHHRPRSVDRPARSIPARAGEPGCATPLGGRGRVYPRACGGTAICPIHWYMAKGLSPRVRGNRRMRLRISCIAGSIPARAGEPGGVSLRHADTWVYPRACGGTCRSDKYPSMSTGLSPRVRGNRPSTCLK